MAATRDVLEDLGYGPHLDAEGVELANCPFHALAEEYTELVSGMNLELMAGMLAALGRPGLEACPDPATGGCCVRLRPPPRRARTPARGHKSEVDVTGGQNENGSSSAEADRSTSPEAVRPRR